MTRRSPRPLFVVPVALEGEALALVHRAPCLGVEAVGDRHAGELEPRERLHRRVVAGDRRELTRRGKRLVAALGRSPAASKEGPFTLEGLRLRWAGSRISRALATTSRAEGTASGRPGGVPRGARVSDAAS